MDHLLTNGMDRLYTGDRVVLVTGPDDFTYRGVLTGWDEIAVYVNGLGFPTEDISELNPE